MHRHSLLVAVLMVNAVVNVGIHNRAPIAILPMAIIPILLAWSFLSSHRSNYPYA